MDAFHFELVSPERVLYSGEVESVVVPGSEGEMTVLAHHAPVMSTLKPGVVAVTDNTAKKTSLFVRGGFVDISTSGLTILAEQAIPLDELDAAALDAQIRNAEEDLSDAHADEAKRLANERLARLTELRDAL
jgi:F-type H+-transporting ATPase subunit epsilon